MFYNPVTKGLPVLLLILTIIWASGFIIGSGVMWLSSGFTESPFLVGVISGCIGVFFGAQIMGIFLFWSGVEWAITRRLLKEAEELKKIQPAPPTFTRLEVSVDNSTYYYPVPINMDQLQAVIESVKKSMLLSGRQFYSGKNSLFSQTEWTKFVAVMKARQLIQVDSGGTVVTQKGYDALMNGKVTPLPSEKVSVPK